ncbi:phospho-sugar mutase [Dermabacter sp. Marseille-Q3180]|uniref:phospho-sugar mutase n=1 Tax=Dermabacter sp. Marseille-Q3180 TaxID=2758090 RepID=UPI0020257952|nr:phospho-sugar mutase [Dermabacter sp. Marseille-Q3180]
MSTLNPELSQRARAWMSDDPDQSTRDDLERRLTAAEAGDEAELTELKGAFDGTLQFGTAGLRGAMGPGPNRMNVAVVSRAAAGIGAYLREVVGEARVVIGYDARYNSRTFAETSAAILTAAGHHVILMPHHWPTPVLAHAVRAKSADCGIMVTASHNPARDNGYKVYLGGRAASEDGNGVQIVPPADAQIAAKIAAVGAVREIPLAESGWEVMPETFVDDYIDAILPIIDRASTADQNTVRTARTDLRIVHTAMHGVGSATMLAAFERAGFTDIHSVKEQQEPDPDFPTVPFPNPEEKGAIDLAAKLAEQVEADLVIANDPDADRCAAAIYDPRREAWRMLHGDELGLLLATYVATHRQVDGTFANSIVSSRSLGALAAARGYASTQTLTGFKWIARAKNIAFGYEEAIGYCVLPNVVKDKDGISAALAIAELAALTKANGSSLVELLDELARELGLYLTSQLSIRVSNLDLISQMMHTLRTAPPSTLAGSAVVEVRDLAEGSLETTGLPPTNGMLLLAEDDSRVIVRPSGTEPKLKAYLEVVSEVEQNASFHDLSAARAGAAEKLENMKKELGELLGARS